MGGKPRHKSVKTNSRSRIKLDFVIQHTSQGIPHVNWIDVLVAGINEYQRLDVGLHDLKCIEAQAKISATVLRGSEPKR